MDNGDYALIVDGQRIRLRKVENIRFVTPARDAHPATTAARLARSSRLAIDPTYPSDSLVVQGDRQKLQETRSYRDIRHTRAAFLGPQGPQRLAVALNHGALRLPEGLLSNRQVGAGDEG
jgi:hypothetical protein